jgi:regulator of protease activity HflC (stomatin/prohibitin superfamily)
MSELENNVASHMEAVVPNKSLYGWLMGGTLAAYGTCGLLAAGTWFTEIVHIGPVHLNWGPVWLLPLGVHFFGFALKEIKSNKIGALYFYGDPAKTYGPGLKFLPGTPFANLATEDHDTQIILEPAHRDKIFWGDEKEDMPNDMHRPVFMNTRAPDDADKKENNPLDTQLQLGVSWEVIWVIDDVPTFRTNMHSLKEAEEQIRGISVTALSEVIATRTADGAIAQQAEVNVEFIARLQKLTENWGVKIRRANLTGINTSHKLAEAMRDRAKAEFEADTKRILAKGEADAIVSVGEARGRATRAETSGPLIGRAEGYGAISKVLGVSGSEVLAAETARETIPGANATILGGGGLAEAASIGALFGAGLKTNDNKKPEGDKK